MGEPHKTGRQPSKGPGEVAGEVRIHKSHKAPERHCLSLKFRRYQKGSKGILFKEYAGQGRREGKVGSNSDKIVKEKGRER